MSKYYATTLGSDRLVAAGDSLAGAKDIADAVFGSVSTIILNGDNFIVARRDAVDSGWVTPSCLIQIATNKPDNRPFILLLLLGVKFAAVLVLFCFMLGRVNALSGADNYKYHKASTEVVVTTLAS